MARPENSEPEWRLWFKIEPDDFETADLGDPDDPDDPFPDPRMDPVPRAFVLRLRELIPTWRELGLTRRLTSGLYDNGHVWVMIAVSDDEGELFLGRIRVDLTESEWIGSWVVGGNSTDQNLDHAEPLGEPVREPFTDPTSGIERAATWMMTQWSRPITRRTWRTEGQVIARSWTFEDSGEAFVASGDQRYWSQPETADEAAPVRPRPDLNRE